MANKKKLLMISYQFPPDSGSIQRIINFVKYLPEFGYHPLILTHKNEQASSKFIDNEFLKNGIQIIRTGKEFNLRAILFKKDKSITQQSISISNTNLPRINIISYLKNIYKSIRSFIIWPDLKVWWIPLALRKANHIIKKEKIDIVYIVTPPHSATIIGFFLKKIANIKLVIDFRDPWANDVDIIMPTNLHRSSHIFAEKLVVKSSNAIITTTDFHSKYFNEKILFNSLTKAQTITNGVDLQVFKPISWTQSDNFTITYTGNFDSSRNPKTFFEAVSKIVNKNPHIFQPQSIKFYGNVNPIVNQDIYNFGLSEIVQQFGLLSYDEVIEEVTKSTLLLLIVHNDTNTANFSIPAKLFEYMATGRPILAITPPGAASEIIEKYNLGICIEHSNVSKIEQVILEYYNLFKTEKLQTKIPTAEILYQYDRKFLTKKLANILDNC